MAFIELGPAGMRIAGGQPDGPEHPPMDRHAMLRLLARCLVAEHVAKHGEVPVTSLALHAFDEVRLALETRLDDPRDWDAFLDAWVLEAHRLASRRPTADPRIGERLRDLVRESGFSASDVAAMIDISRAHLYKVLKNEANVSLSMAARILNAIGCTWSDLDYPGGSEDER